MSTQYDALSLDKCLALIRLMTNDSFSSFWDIVAYMSPLLKNSVVQPESGKGRLHLNIFLKLSKHCSPRPNCSVFLCPSWGFVELCCRLCYCCWRTIRTNLTLLSLACELFPEMIELQSPQWVAWPQTQAVPTLSLNGAACVQVGLKETPTNSKPTIYNILLLYSIFLFYPSSQEWDRWMEQY